MIRYDENDNELFENLLEALDEFGWNTAEIYRSRLIAEGKVSSGKLVNNISPRVAYKAQGGEFTVFFDLPEYYKYVERGLKGKKNSYSPYASPREWRRLYPHILNWIETKGIRATRVDERGKLPDEKGLAAMISKSIAQDGRYMGIAEGNQLWRSVQEAKDIYLPKLQDALEKDWDVYSLKIYDTINRMIKI